MNNSIIYSIFYASLKEIRDLFHKSGRFDDANSKLDEIVKLIALYLYQQKHQFNTPLALQKLVSQYENNASFNLVASLKQAFDLLLVDVAFCNWDGSSIFGANPQLALQDGDSEFAYQLTTLVINSLSHANQVNEYGNKFDLLNEAFGHFVRDNFRNHIEDAQYMTPPEVVEFMCHVAIHDLAYDETIANNLVIADPSCGVGSFLSTFYRLAHNHPYLKSFSIKVFGQDKVDRMVRLSKINMMLFNTDDSQITHGNTLVGESTINSLDGTVDLILTNPPFGARFDSSEIHSQSSMRYPLLHDLTHINGKKFTSELLFIDRYMALLKPNGRLLVVLPDSVISSNGLPATLRQRLADQATIQMMVELPTVTFAQAGTRTKTHILYIRKKPQAPCSYQQRQVFVGLSSTLGFEVKSRKGSPVKVRTGKNDLLDMLDVYKKITESDYKDTGKSIKILSLQPSCVLVDPDQIISNSWTPNHYSAARFGAIANLQSKISDQVELVPLERLVKFVSKTRRRDIVSPDSKCISVLHVMGDGALNYQELLEYYPKHLGVRCEPGDLLFSRINPRIPRMLVVPQFNFPLSCSTEFEIMIPTLSLNNYAIMFLLLSPFVQKQILHLTSGTSSSHNRIKTKELKNVLLPVPKLGSEAEEHFQQVVREFSDSVIILNQVYQQLVKIKPKIADALFMS